MRSQENTICNNKLWEEETSCFKNRRRKKCNHCTKPLKIMIAFWSQLSVRFYKEWGKIHFLFLFHPPWLESSNSISSSVPTNHGSTRKQTRLQFEHRLQKEHNRVVTSKFWISKWFLYFMRCADEKTSESEEITRKVETELNFDCNFHLWLHKIINAIFS